MGATRETLDKFFMSIISPWFPFGATPEPPRLRLFCFPHAGGSAAVFRRWAAPPGIEIRPIQWPGRAERLGEPPFRRLLAMADAALQAMEPFLHDAPYALFGHSLGAKIAYECARTINQQKLPPPQGLFLAGCGPLHLPDHCKQLHTLPDAAFLQGIADQGGTPREIFECEELVHHFLPALRADYTASETYAWRPGPTLPILSVIFGGQEDPDAPPACLKDWQAHFSSSFETRIFPGNHFFLDAHNTEILRIIAEATA